MTAEAKIPITDHLLLEEYASYLFKISDKSENKKIEYFKIQAKSVNADYIYCLKSQLENELIPYIYIFDERGVSQEHHRELTKINKQIWTLGEISLAIIVSDLEIKIIDTRKPITKKYKPNIIDVLTNIDLELRKQIFEGRIIENQTENYVSVSPYQKLLDHIEKEILDKKTQIGCNDRLLKRLLVKFILIKYLEEQTDDNGGSVFKEKYFNSFINNNDNKESYSFCDVLRDGSVIDLLNELNRKFQGGIFNISNDEDLKEISNADFNLVALALDGDKDIGGQIAIWKYYDFNLLPIEFISRLYERFVVSVDSTQKDTGSFYTPPHLARLLIDELLPIDKEIDFNDFKILDPSCGSGIFLVLAYKRLITLWLFSNKKRRIKGIEDINSIKSILKNCIYGVDINSDALSITATSLQIELTSHIKPKEIWDSLTFLDLEKEGNLEQIGFFKWKRQHRNKFNIVVGNPPFNIGDDINKENISSGLEHDYKKEKYLDINNKNVSFPYKNPALAFLYESLDKLLKPDSGNLFMIMPSSTLLYMPTSSIFRSTLFKNWNVKKIYDFTPLKNHLWGKTKIATVAIRIDNSTSTNHSIEHIIIRNTIANEKGAIRFTINKYDRYIVDKSVALKNDTVWKGNLLGGSKIQLYNKKYSEYLNIREFLKENKWNPSTGLRSDKNSERQINLNGKYILDSTEFVSDFINSDMIDLISEDTYKRENKKKVSNNPPNILIRLNIGHKLPIVYNTEIFHFYPGVLGLKGNDEIMMKSFVKTFKANRDLYMTLMKIKSPKVYVQQAGGFTIDANDILELPIDVDSKGYPKPFKKQSDIERAVFEDINLIGENIFKSTGSINNTLNISEIEMYEFAFCEILNYVYEEKEYKFRPIRRILSDDFVWLTFEHGNDKLSVQTSFNNKCKLIYEKIIKDDLSKQGLLINRVITFYGEKNKISFIKPNKLKFWTRSIGFRDAENVKADLLTNGY
ncbi:HsdM family class I SAM-dependent methyltransferase [Lacinutrix algicola]|uniref:HsdM family class I SAM-dependent methyltransferase n=1 Tax=Lacinutrix algicola TaxID=342954 RepID=UPI0006E2086D|nr:N-6 DNA methylase [Lacinutrix algicola]